MMPSMPSALNGPILAISFQMCVHDGNKAELLKNFTLIHIRLHLPWAAISMPSLQDGDPHLSTMCGLTFPPCVDSPDMYQCAVHTVLSLTDSRKLSQCLLFAHSIMDPYRFLFILCT